MSAEPLRGLIIRQPWVGHILRGEKQWEMRGKDTQVRGRIALIEGGSCAVVGTAVLSDVVGPLSLDDLRRAAALGKVVPAESQVLDYSQTFAWVLEDVRPLPRPLPYRHPRGAVIWVRLEPEVSAALVPTFVPARRRAGPR